MAPVSKAEPRQATWQTHELPVLQKTREERMLELSTKAPTASITAWHGKTTMLWYPTDGYLIWNPVIKSQDWDTMGYPTDGYVIKSQDWDSWITNSDRTMGFRPTLAGERSERGEDSAREAASSVPLPAVFWFVSWWSLISFPFRFFIIWTDPTRKIPDSHILQVQY